jgi:hypothetical protein
LTGGILIRPLRNIKWQLVVSSAALLAFTAAMATTGLSRTQGMVFSFFAGLAAGYVEIVTMAGGPLMIDPELLGIAMGTQSLLRGLCSTLSSKKLSFASNI